MVNLWHRACCWGESWQKSHCRPPTIPSCILLYIHFPPFSTYACTLSICFYFSHFLCIQILIKATIFILPLSLILPLATLSSSCYLLSCTQKTCFFFFFLLPSIVAMMFHWTLFIWCLSMLGPVFMISITWTLLAIMLQPSRGGTDSLAQTLNTLPIKKKRRSSSSWRRRPTKNPV